MNDDPIIRFSVPRKEMRSVEQNVAPTARRKPPALGRGLGALLGEVRHEEPLASFTPSAATGIGESASSSPRGLTLLPIAAILPHPDQPRRHFDEAALAELAESIAARGVIQPVIVRPTADGAYQLVAGERRWRAAQRAHLHEIPALIRDLDDREVMALALIENLQREDLNPIEEARAYQRLAEGEAMTQAEIAKMVDKSRSHVANLQRLLSLPESVVTAVETGQLSMGHARALIGAEDADALADMAISKRLSVREVEDIIRRRSRKDRKPRQARGESVSEDAADIIAVQGHLEEFLGLAVRISADADPASGAVTIRYRSLDQLDLICQRLTGAGI